ncbi:hypothetical protein ACFV3R_12870 [Streptomyces sp. NPDC059740]
MRAQDAHLAEYGKLVEQNYRNAGNYYIPLSRIIDYACEGDADALDTSG